MSTAAQVGVSERFEMDRASEDRFREYHEANPHVYAALRKFALEARSCRRRMGMKAIVERARWETTVTARQSSFKLDNTMTSFYARLLMDLEPALRGFFETRRRR